MTPPDSPARPFWVLLVHRAAPETLYEAAAMTASAVSLGIDVTVIWFDAALEELASGRLKPEDEETGSAGRLLAEARDAGGVRYLACSASLVNRRIDREAVAGCVDGVVGWPTAIAMIRGAERSFVW
jgi:peroxiredoxin family protein